MRHLSIRGTRLVVLLVLAAFVASVFLGSIDLEAAAQTSVTKTQAGTPLPPAGDVIVILRKDSLTAASDFAASAGIETKHVYEYGLSGFSGNATTSQIQELAKNPNVVNVIANFKIFAAAQTTPTQIKRTGIDHFGPASIDGSDNPIDIDIAILDGGVDPNHADLNVYREVDCTDTTGPSDFDGHGTHVAGIAAARDNGQGTVGSAPGARIWNTKVLFDDGTGTGEDLFCGLDLVAQFASEIDVANLSLGFQDYYQSATSCGSGIDLVHDWICYVYGQGVAIVVSAGNEGINANNAILAMYPETISVAAINDYNGSPGGGAGDFCGSGWGADDVFADYSNYGSVVDIAAPGTCVYSTVPGGYDYYNGTSMASPLVAGAAALYISQNPGASPSQVRSWLLSDAASKPQSSSVGYTGGSTGTNRILYLGTPPTPTNPPGTANPTFSGTKTPIVNAASTPNTGTAAVVYDGNGYTNWHSGHVYPTSASLRLDLGSAKSISGVKWKFSSLGFADSFTVRLVSASGTVLKTYGPYGNGTASQTFYGFSVSETVNAKFVHFVFTNPIGDSAVGAIGEVEVWQKPLGSPGTLNPSFAGSKAIITNSASTPNTGTARYAHDGSTGSNWAAQGTPTTGSLRFDLGSNKEISGVKWKMAYLGYADSFTVRLISTDGTTRDYGPFTNPTQAQTFFGVAVPAGVQARYVQFHFTNPNMDSAIGSISEVEIWQRLTETYPPGTQNPEPFAPQLGIVNSASTPNTGTSNSTYDGAMWSNWAVQGTPSSASLRFDLGAMHDVADIAWAFSSLGYADKFTIRLVNSSGQITATYGPFGNATAANTWFGIYIAEPNNTRYVHFIFENPNRDVALGAVGEVRINGYDLGAASYDGLQSASDTDFAGEALPVDDTDTDAGTGSTFQAAGRSRGPQPTQSVTYDLGEAQELTGVRWQSDKETVVSVAWSADGVIWTDTGLYASMALPGQWQGTDNVVGVEARYVRVTYHPVTANEPPAVASVVEIWGLGDEPVAATPMSATPEAAQPEASPVAATPEPVDPGTPTASPEPVTDETPSTTVEATEDPATPQPAEDEAETPESTATEGVTPEAAETVEPTATEVVTPEPTAAVVVGTITGTGGDAVNCRVSAPEGEPITQLTEGDAVAVTGPAVDGWVPVICNGQAGFISEEFVTIGNVAPTVEGEPTDEATAPGEVEASPTEISTEEPATEPTATEEPIETPYPIAETGDTENSGTAQYASDDDGSTSWSVYPKQNPEQTRIYFDLGSVVPIDRLTIELAVEGMLPYFEIWLSEDGETWYNATPNGINGWNLWVNEAHSFSLGYDARYVRLVVPNVDESGLSEVGGIRQVEIWPGDINQTQYLISLGNPTTPTPAPEPTLEPTPESTEVAQEEPTETIAEPTEEFIEEPTEDVVEDPTEEVIVEPTQDTEEVPDDDRVEEDPLGG